MKKIFPYTAFLATAILLQSCSGNPFETVVTYNVPLEKARLVFNAELITAKDTFVTYLSKSRTTSESITEAIDTLSKAKVTLWKDGVKYRDLTYVKPPRPSVQTSSNPW